MRQICRIILLHTHHSQCVYTRELVYFSIKQKIHWRKVKHLDAKSYRFMNCYALNVDQGVKTSWNYIEGGFKFFFSKFLSLAWTINSTKSQLESNIYTLTYVALKLHPPITFLLFKIFRLQLQHKHLSTLITSDLF